MGLWEKIKAVMGFFLREPKLKPTSKPESEADLKQKEEIKNEVGKENGNLKAFIGKLNYAMNKLRGEVGIFKAHSKAIPDTLSNTIKEYKNLRESITAFIGESNELKRKYRSNSGNKTTLAQWKKLQSQQNSLKEKCQQWEKGSSEVIKELCNLNPTTDNTKKGSVESAGTSEMHLKIAYYMRAFQTKTIEFNAIKSNIKQEINTLKTKSALKHLSQKQLIENKKMKIKRLDNRLVCMQKAFSTLGEISENLSTAKANPEKLSTLLQKLKGIKTHVENECAKVERECNECEKGSLQWKKLSQEYGALKVEKDLFKKIYEEIISKLEPQQSTLNTHPLNLGQITPSDKQDVPNRMTKTKVNGKTVFTKDAQGAQGAQGF
jgi:hypothetical protein